MPEAHIRDFCSRCRHFDSRYGACTLLQFNTRSSRSTFEKKCGGRFLELANGASVVEEGDLSRQEQVGRKKEMGLEGVTHMDKKSIEVLEIVCFVVGVFLMLFSLASFEYHGRAGYCFPELAKFGIAVGGSLLCLGFLARHWKKGKSE